MEQVRPDLTADIPVSRGSSKNATILAIGLAVTGAIMILLALAKLDAIREPPITAPDQQFESYLDQKMWLKARIVFGGGLAVVGAGIFGVLVPSIKLKEGVAALRPLEGRTKQQVSLVLGKPAEIDRSEGGQVTRGTWKTPMYQIALEFRSDVCTGLVHRRDEL